MSDFTPGEHRPDAELLEAVFGNERDPMPLLEQRARELLSGYRTVVWEGDATNLQFRYVGTSAEDLFGYPRERWTRDPSFWARTVLHPDDRDHAIASYALCTGRGQDQEIEYRAVTADGEVRKLHDSVKVLKGPLGVAVLLRGIMIDVTPESRQEGHGIPNPAARTDPRSGGDAPVLGLQPPESLRSAPAVP